MTGKRFSSVLIGEGALLIQCGDLLKSRGHDIEAIVSSSPAVLTWAHAQGLRQIEPGNGLAEALKPITYDWLFSIANLKMIPASIVRAAQDGTANFHDGPLPRYAGLNAPAWAIIEGAEDYGVVWHEITEGVDEGDILASASVDINKTDTSLSLNTKCFAAGIATFEELVDRIEAGTLEPTRQDFSQRTYFARHARPQGAAVIDFCAPIEETLRLAHALYFGAGYLNPLGLPKLHTTRGTVNVGGVAAQPDTASDAPARRPGEIISVDEASIVVACHHGTVRLQNLTDSRGHAVAPGGIGQPGDVLPALSVADRQALDAVLAELVPHESKFARRLADFTDVTLPRDQSDGSAPAISTHSLTIDVPLDEPSLVAGLLAALAKISGQQRIGVFLETQGSQEIADQWPGLFAAGLPLSLDVGPKDTFASLVDTVRSELNRMEVWRSYPGDLISRSPLLSSVDASVAVRIATPGRQTAKDAGHVPQTAITFEIYPQGRTHRLTIDQSRLARELAEDILERVRDILNAVGQEPSIAISEIPLVTPAEYQDLIERRNATERAYDRAAMVHTLFSEQVARTPDTIALVSDGRELTYLELEKRSNQLAHALVEAGVGPDIPVGLHMSRSQNLVIAALGILKAGGAYVPLDPTYPSARLTHMISDSGLQIVISDRDKSPPVEPGAKVTILHVDDALAGHPGDSQPDSGVHPENLAYVIYTSGSTGKPKGVLVEHRNVVNFMAGMDDRIGRDPSVQSVWLAVTSMSFDISVLELFWTLANGFKIVLYRDAERASTTATRSPGLSRSMPFGLFYWGDDAAAGTDKYKLLLDGARFADTNGFEAIWTPERHFHAFGGPYPNPAVTGAAVAAITSNVQIRAGSCVLPLHHPARVAEDWAVIDNLSHGRVGLAFASGWMPEDFLLRPENAPPNNKAAMFRDISIVQKLWRGEAVSFDAPNGQSVDLVTLPRPVQGELPTWITTAGNPETFRQTGEMGAHVLTHLLGQSIEELGEKIRVYREALAASGLDPSSRKVTLMLHTLVGSDRELVKAQARRPMKHYLQSAAALIKQYAWAFPAFKKPEGIEKAPDIDLQTLDAEELDAIIEFAFERYFNDSGLFGTVDDAVARVGELAAIGVDEIACLIDYGVPAEQVFEGLKPLADVVAACKVDKQAVTFHAGDAITQQPADSIAILIERHGVTHMQCTPAMASLLLLDPDDAKALGGLQYLFIGGEALKGSLLRQLRQFTDASIENMYGPTETTIWSSTCPATATDSSVPLGTPIANTQLYVLGPDLRPVPVGYPGELYIGGDGVTRGYHARPELTQERFLDNPFVAGGRMYRTGDLACYEHDGSLRFLGRADHQVKVRGYRIELGEVEEVLSSHADVQEAIVLAVGESANDARLVAYLRCGQKPPGDEDLRAHLGKQVPEFMIPSVYVKLDQFPLTPNGKIDRLALTRIEIADTKAVTESYVEPGGDTESKIADVFKTVLGVSRVGRNDNFFSRGGHSLLAIQAHRALKGSVGPDLTITDIYRFPTVAGLASRIDQRDESRSELQKVASRAAMRRNAMAGRGTFSSQKA